MYKYAGAVLALLFLAACSHSNGEAVDVNKDINDVQPGDVFKSLTISWNGAVNPTKITKEISIDDKNNLTLKIESYYQGDLADSCNGSGVITAENLNEISQKVLAADLVNYAPADDASLCVGEAGTSFVYVAADGTQNEFTATNCNMEPEIKAIAVTLSDIGTALVPDCTEESVAIKEPPADGTKQPTDGDDQKPADETGKQPADDTEKPAATADDKPASGDVVVGPPLVINARRIVTDK
ncbi:MAG: hypothetical protein WC956_00615 [bacterium]